ncbi:UNKNOWN [Stylonychia lemnae]|uniref:Uncharacterized protein n=1 Tax=Stylonychia lemnae TaxID=5949 RepID=A0A077ZZ13_STYLE|nr:UNKNOWN [Stylonychia lemnae]|eukprot:CDW75196.1 UNKNOWN [Stylonychia lemnae]
MDLNKPPPEILDGANILQTIEKIEKESAVEAATRFAALAEQQETQKNYKQAEESNHKASLYYLEAMAMMKQQPQFDSEALKTLEILSETHRRKGKLLAMRKDWGVASVRNKVNQMIKNQEQLKKATNNQFLNSGATSVLLEKEKLAIIERERYMSKMKEQMIILYHGMFIDAKKQLENLVEYQKTKLQKFESRLNEILNTFKKGFNDQTKELILSHGEKFISVNTNPFAKEALRESINITKIEKNNQNMEKVLQALNQYTILIGDKLGKVVQKFDEMSNKEKSLSLTYGQLTAVAITPIGQQVGFNQIIDQSDRELLETMQRQAVNQDLQESIIGNENRTFQRSHSMGYKGVQEVQHIKPMPVLPGQPQFNENQYQDVIRKMEQSIKQLEQNNKDLERKYKKYYGYTKNHLNEMKSSALPKKETK